MGNARERRVRIGGRPFVITSDDGYLDAIGDDFQPYMVELFRTVAADSEVILDVGANIGCTALLFAELGKRVYAFEPSPTTFAFLEVNVERAHLSNVRLLNIGLGAESGDFTLTFSPSNRAGAFVSDKTQASRGHSIEQISLRTLDEFVGEVDIRGGIGFIKIDVEGFEGHVLRGAAKTLQANRPNVVLELNHWCLNAFQRISVPDFFDFLRSVFPILLALDGDTYLNLHDANESYMVMYRHILERRYRNILGAFHESRISGFRSLCRHEPCISKE
jgi:FkbM family methyltransferase